jgi:hypothetical protein
MSTELDTDIAALVGELEAPACEHSQHGESQFHSDEPASHYVQSHCQGCTAMRVYPACPRFVTALMAVPFFQCMGCGTLGPTPDFFTILGPVNK